jgi:hypothetical protein
MPNTLSHPSGEASGVIPWIQPSSEMATLTEFSQPEDRNAELKKRSVMAIECRLTSQVSVNEGEMWSPAIC